MKVKWREHEAALVTIIALITIVGYIRAMIRLTPQQMDNIRLAFANNHVPFNYYTHILLPQIGCIILLWLVYLWINRMIIPRLPDIWKRTVFTFLWIVLQLLVIVYAIGPGINFISFYLNPFMVPGIINYFPLTFGSHPQPFLNTTGGLDVAIFLTGLYAVYAAFREIIIYTLERPGTRKLYRIAIANQITIFLVIFFAIPFFCSVFNLATDSYYMGYFAFVPAILLVFITNTYMLFPVKREKSWFNFQFIGPIMFFSFIWSFVFSIFLGPEWSIGVVLGCWAVQLFVVTPISWIDYQQRKDKILELRGVEAALVKSKADLQFLRSQINPHFLFNALNTLYGTALIEGSKNTAEGIQKLGDMMRFMLHENTLDFIPMEKEIEYLKNYISLQKLRTQSSPDIIIEDEISEQGSEQAIAPMLLIPFVENAFKHGVSLTEKSWIKIKLTFDAENIFFEVRNSLHQSNANDPEKDNSGIGLKNVQERLLLLYPGKHQFIYGKEGAEFVARLTVNKIGAIKRKVKIF
jgi:two-component system, LytTR family, sensor kinase